MKAYDPVHEYLRERGCPAHVVKMGLKGLVSTWEKVVAELVFDGYRFGLADYLNDLDRREILEGALVRLSDRVPVAMRDRVALADRRFTDVTVEAARCLLGDEEAASRAPGGPVDPARHFWYFRYPGRHRAAFARDLAEANIAPRAS